MPVSQVQTASSGVTAGVQLIPNLPSGGRAGYLHLAQLSAGAAANATLTVYDSVNGTTNQIYELAVPQTWSNMYDFLGGLAFKNGLYVVVAGTGATARLTWE
jgi:hypothetical protein